MAVGKSPTNEIPLRQPLLILFQICHLKRAETYSLILLYAIKSMSPPSIKKSLSALSLLIYVFVHSLHCDGHHLGRNPR